MCTVIPLERVDEINTVGIVLPKTVPYGTSSGSGNLGLFSIFKNPELGP